MKWIGERISFVDQKDKATFVIYPPKIGWKLYLIYLWIALWLVIGGIVFAQLFMDYSENEKIILFVFLSFWVYFAVRVIRTSLYLTFGREYIRLDESGLHIKIARGKYGKSKRYFLENIAKIRREELKETSIQATYESSPWVMGSNRIQFDYLGKVISFGKKLSDKDAKMLFNILVKRIESHLRKAKKKNP